MKFVEGWRMRRSRSSSDDTPRLCFSCENLSLRRLLKLDPSSQAKGLAHRLAFADIKSQRHHCDFCRLLYHAIKNVSETVVGNHDKNIQTVTVSSHAKHQLKVTIGGSHRLELSLSGHEAYKKMPFEQTFYLQEMFTELLGESNQGCSLVDQRPINFSEVKQWLSDCQRLHGLQCRPATNYGFVRRPSRLLVVDVHKMCLVDLPAEAKYVALSYVWGGVRLLHLNKGNLSSLRQQGSLAQSQHAVPATLQDAIKVTKEIGLQYIWIDSLCIQQDDSEETAYQVANMHNIFGSAHVAIVAAEGNSANSGLLGTRSRPRKLHYGIEMAESEPGSPIYRRIGPGLSLGLVALKSMKLPLNSRKVDKWNVKKADALPRHSSISESIWNSRAWCFQESLLSSRALVFLDGQVFWHCNKSVWCEPLLGRKLNTSGKALDSRYQRLRNLTSSPHFQKSWKKHDASVELKRDGRTVVVSSEALTLYKCIVADYTPRAIGKLGDRLAAFDGIGKVLEQCLLSQLTYGLPESLIDVALLWRPKRSIRNVHKEIHAFPSWSWCGWQGAIEYETPYGIEHGEPRKLHEHESAEERIRPLVRWYKTNEAGMFEPTDDRGIGIREALQPNGLLPHDWKGVLAPSEDRNIDINLPSPSPQLLRCYTVKATKLIRAVTNRQLREEVSFKETIDGPLETLSFIHNYYRVYNNESEGVIGEVVLDDASTALRLTSSPGPWKVDLIALSETQFFRSHELNMESCGNMYKRPFDYTLYNVMAVTWSQDGQTAYRRGLGRVFQDAWHRESVEFGCINLG